MADAETFDVIVLGSGIAGLAAALAAHEHGLRPVLIEKADRIGGTTTDSYGLIWVGGNHLMRRAGADRSARRHRQIHDVSRRRRTVRGAHAGAGRPLAGGDRFYEACGIPFRLIGGMVDHYFGVVGGRARRRPDARGAI